MYEIILTFWDYDDAALIENEYYFADTEEDAIDIVNEHYSSTGFRASVLDENGEEVYDVDTV